MPDVARMWSVWTQCGHSVDTVCRASSAEVVKAWVWLLHAYGGAGCHWCAAARVRLVLLALRVRSCAGRLCRIPATCRHCHSPTLGRGPAWLGIRARDCMPALLAQRLCCCLADTGAWAGQAVGMRLLLGPLAVLTKLHAPVLHLPSENGAWHALLPPAAAVGWFGGSAWLVWTKPVYIGALGAALDGLPPHLVAATFSCSPRGAWPSASPCLASPCILFAVEYGSLAGPRLLPLFL